MSRLRYEFPEQDLDVNFPVDLRQVFWRWFNENRDVVIARVRVGVWFVKFTEEVTLGDLEPFFQRLF